MNSSNNGQEIAKEQARQQVKGAYHRIYLAFESHCKGFISYAEMSKRLAEEKTIIFAHITCTSNQNSSNTEPAIGNVSLS